jgi:hypothetical protein
MGVHILEDRESNEAAFYCSTSGWAFGPVFPNREAAELFLQVYSDDPRRLTDAELSARYSEFINGWVCECGSVRDLDEEIPELTGRFECAYCSTKTCATCGASRDATVHKVETYRRVPGGYGHPFVKGQ